MLTPENVSTARLRYERINGKKPRMLFLSLDSHTELVVNIRGLPQFDGMASLQGALFMGMEIHVVPTIQGPYFSVA